MLEAIKVIIEFLKAPNHEATVVKVVLEAVGVLYGSLVDLLAFGVKQDSPEIMEQLGLLEVALTKPPEVAGSPVLILLVQLLPIILEFLRKRK